jgi:hypothetical protein
VREVGGETWAIRSVQKQPLSIVGSDGERAFVRPPILWLGWCVGTLLLSIEYEEQIEKNAKCKQQTTFHRCYIIYLSPTNNTLLSNNKQKKTYLQPKTKRLFYGQINRPKCLRHSSFLYTNSFTFRYQNYTFSNSPSIEVWDFMV